MSGTIDADLEDLQQQPAVLRKGMTLPVAFVDSDALAAALTKSKTLDVDFAPSTAVPAALARTIINGTPGQGFTNRGAWVSGTNYAAYDVLTNGGQTFLCILSIVSSTTAPGPDATHFLLWAQKGADGIGTPGANGAGYAATSTTSLATAGSGSKAFATQSGLAYSAGARIRATSAGSGEWMEGVVSAYSGSTLTATMDSNSGTGAHADWNINLAGQGNTKVSLTFAFDAGAAFLSAGGATSIIVPNFAGTITSSVISSKQSDTTGSAVIDIRKSTAGTYPGTTTSICAAAKPTLTGANIAVDSTLTGWTTSFSAGDILYAVLNSCSGLKGVSVNLKVTKT